MALVKDRRGLRVPHLTIEYSSNVANHHDIDALVAAVHAAALAHGLAAVDATRTRAAAREHYLIADGDPTNAFIAVAARIGPGRDVASKRSFITRVLDAAEACVTSERSPLAIAWSAEVTEIDPEVRLNRNRVRTRLENP